MRTVKRDDSYLVNMTFSLRHKINTAILVTFGFIAVIFTVVQLPFQARRLEMEIGNVKLLLQTLVERDENELANEIFDLRIKAIEIRLKEIQRIEGVLGAAVLDIRGKVLASVGEIPAGRNGIPLGLSIPVTSPAASSSTQRLSRNNTTILAFSRGISFLGEQTGVICIHYSLARLMENQRTSLMIFWGLMIATLAVMLILLNLILSKAIISPLMYIKTAASAVVQGNYDSPLILRRRDELGNLAQSFDTMRSAVKEKVRDLEQLKEKYRLLYQKAPVMLLTVDQQGRITEANDRLAETLGVLPEDLIGSRSFEFFADEFGAVFHKDILAFIRTSLSSAGRIRDRQYRMTSGTGEILEVLVSVFVQKNREGVITQATISIQDVTERRKAESALKKSEQQLRLVTGNMADVISQTDTDARMTYVSPSVERVLGYRPEALLGEEAAAFIHPEDIDRVMELAAEARQQGQSSLLIRYRWRHARGHYIWVESAVRLLFRADGKSGGAVFGTRDISQSKKADEERQRLESQLLQSQKLESIGRLAGGVAHDLNNLLTPVLGYSEMLMGAGEGASGIRRKAEAINKAGGRAKTLVHQLLAFSRKQTLDFKSLDINLVLTQFEKLLLSTLREDIRLDIICGRELPPVMADEGQIEQVIMNLAINSAEAMDRGGRLTIETAMAELDEAYAANRPGTEPGRYVVLSVSDTGHGMDKETKAKIFEPFFSTRGEQGTGLGLATVYGIVKQHGGNIWVYSEPDHGTTVKVYLPATEEAPVREDLKTSARPAPEGSETIMLVEDEASVLELAAESLRQHGYTVFTAGNGQDAVNLVQSRKIAADLLLTDVVMPGLNGRELYTVLSGMLPGLKVLYMSGYTNNIITHHGVLDQGLQFIQKPFTTDSLARKVRNVLDRMPEK